MIGKCRPSEGACVHFLSYVGEHCWARLWGDGLQRLWLIWHSCFYLFIVNSR
jgi:hypothetical protein